MKHKTIPTYRTTLGFRLLSALLLTGQRKRYLSDPPRMKLPSGSVAPLY